MHTQGPIELNLPDIWQLPMDTALERDYRKNLILKWLACKQLSHAWQLGGKIDLPNRLTINLTGMNLFNFKYILRIGLSEFSQKHDNLLPKEDLSYLSTLLADRESSSLKQSADLLYADFQKGSPISVLTGFKGHRVVVSFDGNYLILANKGRESRKPLEVYRIDRLKINATVLQRIIDLSSQRAEDYAKWLKQIHEHLSAVKNSLCVCIEQAYPLSSSQQVGNCEWESLQTNIYGALLFHRLKNCLTRKEKETLLTSTNQTFQEWQQFMQLQALGTFFEIFNIKESGIAFKKLDPGLLHSLFIQYWSTPSPSIEFKTKMDELETHYFQNLDSMTRALRKTEKIYYTTRNVTS